jgi:hypothetical protein
MSVPSLMPIPSPSLFAAPLPDTLLNFKLSLQRSRSTSTGTTVSESEVAKGADTVWPPDVSSQILGPLCKAIGRPHRRVALMVVKLVQSLERLHDSHGTVIESPTRSSAFDIHDSIRGTVCQVGCLM